MPIDLFLTDIARHPDRRIAGTAVFMTGTAQGIPPALLHNLKHNKVLHERNVILSVAYANVPRIDDADRVAIERLSETFALMRVRFGYMENPSIPHALALAGKLGWNFNLMETTFFLSRRWITQAKHSAMPRWQEKLFIGLVRNASSASEFFRLPTGRVMEVGMQVAV